MSNIIGKLVYMITGDTASLETNLDSSKKKVKELGAQVDKTGERIRQFAKGAITATLIKSLVDAASRVEELESKFNTVFDGISSTTDKWVRDYASATNRGVTATKEFLATQQDLRTGYGDSIESAAEYSKAVVAITNDLASFSNVPIEQAMQSMQSGLNQQFEALRSLGVSLSVATLEQGEYAKSLGKTWEEMSALEKQEAILSGVVSQSKNAIHQSITDWRDYNYLLGDAARTSSSFANTSQGLMQTLDDLKAELGNAILPAATDATSLLTELMKRFNALPEPIQATTTAIAAFAAATSMISGPVGIAVGAVSALSIALGQTRTAQEKLEAQTWELKATTSEYQSITSRLSGSTDDLTESEQRLLKVQQEIQKSKAQVTLQSLAESYDGMSLSLEESTKRVDAYQAQYDALVIAMTGGKEACEDALKSIDDTSSAYGKAFKLSLDGYAGMSDRGFEKESEKFEEQFEKLSLELNEKKAGQAEANAILMESILEVALAYNSGLIDIELFKSGNEDLYNSIIAMAEELKGTEENIGKISSAEERAAYRSTEWTDALKEQRAEILESNGEYEKAYEIRKELNAREKEDSIRKLASDAGLIESGENLAQMEISTLRERLAASEDTNKELIALDEYYSNQDIELAREKTKAIEDTERELAEKRKENAKEVENLIKSQIKEGKEALASDLEGNGEYEKAYDIRKEILQEEADIAIAEMRRKVDEGIATNEEIIGLEQYYSGLRIELENEKNRKLEEARKQNARSIESMLEQQKAENGKSTASELERIGQYEKATAIRIALIHQERDEALEAMQEKIDQGTATEEELLKIRQYYANEESELIKEQTEKMRERMEQSVQTALSTMKSFSNDLQDLFSSITEARIAAIDKETQAQLEALGLQEETEHEKLLKEYNEAIKNGDMELAQEKARELERQRIEDEAEEKKAKVQREAAEREKRFAIFQATIDTLAAVIGFMADPGSYAGIALSAVAAAQGAMQIAAIQAQPLPSYAVGAVDVSEDHIAQIHQGELIIPKTFAQGIRDGDISIGEQSSSVLVTIINNTGADTNVERSENADQTELIVTIGKIVDSQISKGRFDKTMESRYEISRRKTRA